MNYNPPFAPMPPGMPYQAEDPFGPPPPMPPHQGDPDIPIKNDEKPKKAKKPKVAEVVEREFFGYSLEPVPARPGENKCWQRVGRRTLPFEQQKLLNMVTFHRQRTRVGPAHDLAQCTSAQQGVINRLIMECRQNEKNPNADWVLVDVQRFGEWHWKSLEVKRIQVILKRHDKTLSKPRDAAVRPDMGGYQEFEIIDLAEPFKEPKTESKKDKKSKKKDGNDEFNLDDPPGLFSSQPVEPPYVDQHAPVNHPQGGYVQDPHGYHEQAPPPPQYPPLFDPMNQANHGWGAHQIPPGGIPADFYSARQPTGNNPFIPNPDQMPPPGQYDPNVLNNPPNLHQYPVRPSARATPAPQERRSPSRHRSRSTSRLRAALKQERADKAELQARLERLDLAQRPLSDHSSGSRSSDPVTVFSEYPAGEAFSPPSTPPRSDHYAPRGSLHRRRSSELREARYGSKRYRDESADVRTGHTARPRTREASPRYRRTAPRPTRPVVLHSPSSSYHDDYPRDDHYYSSAQSPRLQRRLTEGAYGYHPVATYNQENRRRREDRRHVAAYGARPPYERRRSDRLFGDERYL